MKDPSVNFYIQSAGKERLEYRVIMSACFDGKRLIYYPGVVLESRFWDRENQCTKGLPDSHEINRFLIELKRNVLNIYRSLSIRYGEVSIRYFREQLEKVKIAPGRGFHESYLRFLEEVLEEKTTSSYLKCKSLYRKLRDFEERQSIDLSLEGCDLSFMKHFQGFLLKEGLAPGSIRSYIGVLKWFLNRCREKNWLINDEYRRYRPVFSGHSVERNAGTRVYLNAIEIGRILSYETADRKKVHVKNIFCFMVFSGLDPALVFSLDRRYFEKAYLAYTDKKGKARKLIPGPEMRELLSYYENRYFTEGRLFPKFSEPTLNKYIRQIARECQLDRQVERYPGNQRVSLHECITINSAGLSYILRAHSQGTALPVIAASTGRSLDWVHRFIIDTQIE